DDDATDSSGALNPDALVEVLAAADESHAVLEDHAETLDLCEGGVLFEGLVGVEAVLDDPGEETRAVARFKIVFCERAWPQVAALVLHPREKRDLVTRSSLVAVDVLVDELLGSQNKVERRLRWIGL